MKTVALCWLLLASQVPVVADGLGRLRYSRILLRDFRTVKDGQVINYNIGTAAHCPGTIAVLRRCLPEAKITVWADAPLAPGLAGMMRRHYPDIPVVYGSFKNGVATSPELAAAVNGSDLFLISSGNGIAGSVGRSLQDYRQATGKPASAYAIGCSKALFPLLAQLESVSLRDRQALQTAMAAQVPLKLWAPDAVFYFQCADTAFADEFMRSNHLEKGRFICVIPGWRYTPRWEFWGTPVNAVQQKSNEEHLEHDQGLLREVIIRAVRRFNVKVLLCAEQIPEMTLLKKGLYDALPQDVADNCVVLPSYWEPDQALAVYKCSCLVCGIEMHSQVMALGNGIPAVIFRHRNFGSKSSMWNDIGLSEWLVDIDDSDSVQRAVDCISAILADVKGAETKVLQALKRIDEATRKAVNAQFRQPQLEEMP